MQAYRFFLVTVLLVSSLFLKQAWDRDYGAGSPSYPDPVAPETETPPLQVAPAAVTPSAVLSSEPESDLPSPPEFSEPLPDTNQAGKGEEKARLLRVRTDVLEVLIDPYGGTLRRLSLLAYPISVQNSEIALRLLDDDAQRLYLLQGGLLSGSGPGTPHNRARYRVERMEYFLEAGQDELEVRLRWEEAGLVADKVYTFRRGSYLFDVAYEIRNLREEPWSGVAYAQLKRGTYNVGSGIAQRATFTGIALSTPRDRYDKTDFDDISKERKQRSENAWIAILQHYFVAALLPAAADQEYTYYMKAAGGDNYLAGSFTPAVRLEPGASGRLYHRVYAGPKIQRDLAAAAANLDLTVDYGILWFIAKPLFRVLEFFYALGGNWGLAIILLTVLVKALFYYPTAISYRSMARMGDLRPRLLALRERYKDDRQRLQQEMMRLYREEKINPFGGCLPILIQMPVFIALYWVLLESVELRQAPFMLWYRDLSSADPYFVLPLVMGLTMYLQQKLSPTALDPVQEKVFALLPVVFTFLFAFFPSGLVLYWVVNNVLSILQQWYIRRKLHQTSAAKPA